MKNILLAVVAACALSAVAETGHRPSRGLLLLTFDDYKDWTRQIPIFAKYGAHASFFPCGHLSSNHLVTLKKMADAGHTVGIHTEGHADAPPYFAQVSPDMYMRRHVQPQVAALKSVGIVAKSMAYPNNRHSDATDAYLSLQFDRFRAGVKGVFKYATNGTSIVTIDRAFFPVADLSKHRVIEGVGVGEYYATDIDDLCRGIRRAAERDEVFALFSHDIADRPQRLGMSTDCLEKLLRTAKDCGVAVKGFDELGPVDPIEPEGPLELTLTFDDSCKDHWRIAADELEKRGWRGLFCIVTDWIGKDEKKMTWDDVRDLVRRGHEIATHTKTHPLGGGGLGWLYEQGRTNEVVREIVESADRIEKETGVRPRLLCLPGGGYCEGVGKIARRLGLRPMLRPRTCFGAFGSDSAERIAWFRSRGLRSADFLVHGVTPEGGGWKPFGSRAAFIGYLDGIKRMEESGAVVVKRYE